MLPQVFLIALPILTLGGGIPSPLGVPPELQTRYTPSSSSPPTWKCLDGSEEILWTEVNDDFCDCSDGSDEPGTSACPDTMFYCANEGYIGARIPKSRVHDGKCEQECCDGSDEPSGICQNICKEVGKAYKLKADSERKIRKTGSKVRSTYIAFAQKEKKRLEESIMLLEREVSAREKEVARLKVIKDQTESLSASDLEFKKKSPLYQSLLTHHLALKSLRKTYLNHVEREKLLGDILETLKGGYNPNYQDMAVLEAVRGWEALSTTKGADGEEESEATESESTPLHEESDWTEEQLDNELDNLLGQDHVTLLLGHEAHIAETPSLLFDLSSYIPDTLLPHFKALQERTFAFFSTLGIIHGSAKISDEMEQARAAFAASESKLNSVRAQILDEQAELKKLFDPEGYGQEGEWKKLQGLCLSKDTGEYVYEVCMFGAATQKQGGSHNNLGKFSSWSTDRDVKPGEPHYYQTQHYTGGAKCWNGPERSVTLHLTCGTENEILTIAEPEKCEYHLTGTTPALCLPLDATKQKEEL